MTTDSKPEAIKLTPAQRKKAESLLWKNKHRDFRGVMDGVKNVLYLNPKTGGTELWPISSFTDEQLINELPRSVREGFLKNG